MYIFIVKSKKDYGNYKAEYEHGIFTTHQQAEEKVKELLKTGIVARIENKWV